MNLWLIPNDDIYILYKTPQSILEYIKLIRNKND